MTNINVRCHFLCYLFPNVNQPPIHINTTLLSNTLSFLYGMCIIVFKGVFFKIKL